MSYFKQLLAKATSNGSWYPQTQRVLANNEEASLGLDIAGNLVTRSSVLTDEGSFYEPFAGNSLGSKWTSVIGTGGSVTVANSKCNLLSGTTAASKTMIYAQADYSPVTLSYTLTISQRIANQDIYFGYGNHPTDPSLDTMFARFHAYGTDNTKISCETQSSGDTGGNQGLNTQILLPLGMNTTENLQYRIIHTSREVHFYAGRDFEHMILLATNSIQIPDPYTILFQRVRFVNGTTPASSTTVSVDNITLDNKNVLDVAGEVTGTVNVGQTVSVSTVNSSTTNLTASPTAGYIFVGLPEPTTDVADLQISLKTDQNCFVYVEQSPDGTNWDISDTFNYNRLDTAGFGINVQAISSYFRVRVENRSTSTATTYFRLQSILCPIAEPLPRAVSDMGNLKVGIYELEDEFGNKGSFTPMKDLKVAQPYRLVGASFGASIDTTFWTATNSATTGATSAVANSMATMTSGTQNNGYGQITSFRTGRFIFAHPNMYRSIIRIPNLSVTNNTRRWGVFTLSTATPVDGFYFELSGANVLSCVRANAGSFTPVSSGSFNGVVSEFVMDSNAHAYEIVYFLGSIQFYIDGVVVHTMRPTTAMLSNNFTLPVTATSINSATGVLSGTIEMWAGIILRLGREISAPQWRNISGATAITTLKSGSGTLRKVVLGTMTPAGTLILYDALSATNPIGTITWTNNQAPSYLSYDLDFYTGLSYVITGGGNFTIVFE